MMTDLLILNTTEPVQLRGFRPQVTILEYQCGLLYRHGKLIARLGPGRHRFWGSGHALMRVDLRRQTFTVAGQEVLSADNAALKISVAVTLRVVDPVKTVQDAQDWRGQIHCAVQLALRAAVAAEPVERLLAARLELGRRLLAAVEPEAARVGVAVEAAEVKDVMFPGELKKAFGEVIKARQEGQAALERARGESAALRNLANAARLLEGNPALQNLRLLQSITAAGTTGGTLVLGVPGGFLPLPSGGAAAPAAEAGGE